MNPSRLDRRRVGSRKASGEEMKISIERAGSDEASPSWTSQGLRSVTKGCWLMCLGMVNVLGKLQPRDRGAAWKLSLVMALGP